jgi:2'-5' RNA ligase
MRLFAAVLISDGIAENIYKYSQPSAMRFGARSVPAENMHITLKFFVGKEPENCLKIIENSVRNIKAFDVSVKGTGFFSYGKYAGTLWAGIHDGSGCLNKIALNIDSSKKEFVPHITLARFKNDSVENGVLNRHLSEVFLKEKEFGSFTVGAVSLIESVLEPEGAKYKVIKKIYLGK